MNIQVNLNGRKRKELATAVSEVLSAEVTYKGPPTYNFEVGKAIIGRDGTVVFNAKRTKDAATLNRLLEGLSERGFEPQLEEETPVPDDSSSEAEAPPSNGAETPPELEELSPAVYDDAKEFDKGTVYVPLEELDKSAWQNLHALVRSKATLIKKALNIDDLPIKETEHGLYFPWLETDRGMQEVKACQDFITAMCEMAKRQKRVLAVEKPTDNEKFTFRLFLVRLGLIGDEYAETRRVLLQNLPGNGSWKNVDGTSANPRTPKAEIDFPDFLGKDDAESAQRKISFIKRLGYFLLHFDE